jgi:hypothetical protein
MRKPVRLALAIFVLIASFTVIHYTYRHFFDAWTDILLAIFNWGTLGHRLSPATVVKAVVYSVIVGLAGAALTISALDTVYTVEAITARKTKS